MSDAKPESPWVKIDRIDRRVTWLLWTFVGLAVLSGALRIVGGVVHEATPVTLNCVTSTHDQTIVIRCEQGEAGQ